MEHGWGDDFSFDSVVLFKGSASINHASCWTNFIGNSIKVWEMLHEETSLYRNEASA